MYRLFVHNLDSPVRAILLPQVENTICKTSVKTCRHIYRLFYLKFISFPNVQKRSRYCLDYICQLFFIFRSLKRSFLFQAGIRDEETHRQAKTILMELGQFYQVLVTSLFL